MKANPNPNPNLNPKLIANPNSTQTNKKKPLSIYLKKEITGFIKIICCKDKNQPAKKNVTS